MHAPKQRSGGERDEEEGVPGFASATPSTEVFFLMRAALAPVLKSCTVLGRLPWNHRPGSRVLRA